MAKSKQTSQAIDLSDLLSITEFARERGVHKTYVYWALRANIITPVIVGRDHKFIPWSAYKDTALPASPNSPLIS